MLVSHVHVRMNRAHAQFRTNQVSKQEYVDYEFVRTMTFEFSVIHHFLPNRGRILPVLIYNGPQPMNVSVGGFCQDLAENCKL